MLEGEEEREEGNMPIPSPKSDEPSKVFISRCVSNKIMIKEYPDKKQRLAICYSQLRRVRGEKTLKK